MNVIIVGCGQVGQTLAEQLIDSGNNVTVIDTVYENVKALTDRVDALGIVGNGDGTARNLEGLRRDALARACARREDGGAESVIGRVRLRDRRGLRELVEVDPVLRLQVTGP